MVRGMLGTFRMPVPALQQILGLFSFKEVFLKKDYLFKIIIKKRLEYFDVFTLIGMNLLGNY